MTCVDRGFLVFGAYCISFGCDCKGDGGGVSGPTHLDFQGQIDGIQVERRS